MTGVNYDDGRMSSKSGSALTELSTLCFIVLLGAAFWLDVLNGRAIFFQFLNLIGVK